MESVPSVTAAVIVGLRVTVMAAGVAMVTSITPRKKQWHGIMKKVAYINPQPPVEIIFVFFY